MGGQSLKQKGLLKAYLETDDDHQHHHQHLTEKQGTKITK
jgi:hypothetical protein